MNNENSTKLKKRYYVSAVDVVVDRKTGKQVELLVEHLCWSSSSSEAADEARLKWELNGYNVEAMQCDALRVR
jgi:hypothetical protein